MKVQPLAARVGGDENADERLDVNASTTDFRALRARPPWRTGTLTEAPTEVHRGIAILGEDEHRLRPGGAAEPRLRIFDSQADARRAACATSPSSFFSASTSDNPTSAGHSGG